jgi:hypothetical protein
MTRGVKPLERGADQTGIASLVSRDIILLQRHWQLGMAKRRQGRCDESHLDC